MAAGSTSSTRQGRTSRSKKHTLKTTTMTGFKYGIVLIAALMGISASHGQDRGPASITPALWDGLLIAGYVDKGAFVNFGGPCVKFSKQPYAIALGMLPSLRIKQDRVAGGAGKNATVTPSLGVGVSLCYKHLALQVPFYYNPKTAAGNGRWVAGIGAGYRF